MMGVSMSSKRYTEAFKVEAVKQVTDRGHAVADVAGRLGSGGWISLASDTGRVFQTSLLVGERNRPRGTSLP